jgi:16S rRNA (guanine1516-N2)-methyltransferase
VTHAVCIYCRQRSNTALALAKQLNIPCVSEANAQHIFSHCLIQTPHGLALTMPNKKELTPLIIDFDSKKLNYRRQSGGGKKQALAKAIGLSKHPNPHVLDATAGLGQDAFILASLGCRLTLLERSPIVCALLNDALKRSQDHPELAAITRRMTLVNQEAVNWLKQQTAPVADIIYLDPMFPDKKKSAAVKKEMLYLQSLVGQAQDTTSLLTLARHYAKHRVVVKRHKLAPPLDNSKPTHQLIGKSTRFDIYAVFT